MLPRKIPKTAKRASRWRSLSLAEIFRLDDNGQLYWIARPREMFDDERSFKTWNSRFAEEKAITSLHSAGYYVGTLFGETVFAHRIIGEMLFGDISDCEIDHINGIRSDNRPQNLRPVSRQENRKNIKIQKTNTTGHIGIRRSGARWRATIQSEGVLYNLGTFHTQEEAVLVRKNAETRMGFHPNHGRS